jgi:hypothetical protein
VRHEGHAARAGPGDLCNYGAGAGGRWLIVRVGGCGHGCRGRRWWMGGQGRAEGEVAEVVERGGDSRHGVSDSG